MDMDNPMSHNQSTPTLIHKDGFKATLPFRLPRRITQGLQESNRWKSLLGLATFVALEAAFFTFAFICLKMGNIPLDGSSKRPKDLDTTNVELQEYISAGIAGVWSLINNIWHTVATAFGGVIVMETLVKEWSARILSAEHPKTLVPQDPGAKVSSPLSGNKDRLLYCLKSKSSTKSFRIAFLASLGMLLLKLVAPGAVTAAVAPYTGREDLHIGVFLQNLSLDNDANEGTADAMRATVLLSLHRTTLIVNMEQVDDQLYGYGFPHNVITSWPIPRDSDDFFFEGKYNSDIVTFMHNCHWEKPEFSAGTIIAGGLEWMGNFINFSEPTTSDTEDGSAIFPLVPLPVNGNLPPKSAYMFLGGNATFQTTENKSYAIDLGGLPTFNNGGKIKASAVDLVHEDHRFVLAPLTTVLVCEPNPTRFGGIVEISGLSLNVRNGTDTPVESISQSAVNLLFSLGLFQPIAEADPVQGINIINFAATTLFMERPEVDWSKDTAIKPADTKTIASNMDKFMQSAAKGLAEGFRSAGGDTATITYDNVTVDAYVTLYKKQLSANKLNLFGAIALFIILLPLLIILHVSQAYHPERLTFNLENILMVSKWLQNGTG
ncbi:hypothetical protein M422DRAFT_274272 [Sphaerobolus stellatus SS14]|uniref:Uncharacterized protein n=1 Tax=Sphaerobolus stellatus (strain SS14) TaxID=990650 RepID=A0A0C9UHH3_SPHS4|nr:hypothetical protein M422DRAFT_274272 [Sphaerobolus stellatus SS14]